jgi:hypothetical protein
VSTAEQIVTAISSLTNPAKIATLKSVDACNPRLNKCAYWMNQATANGLDVKALIIEALARNPDTVEHRKLTLNSLLKNYRQMVRLGCFTAENLLRLRNGNPAIVSKGIYKGQQMEVDHVVPKSLMPALAREFFNLCYMPYTLNRKKSDAIGRAQLRAVKVFERHRIVPEGTVVRLQELLGLSVRFARLVKPGTMARLHTVPSKMGITSGATDPRFIITVIEQLVERISDWEPRADSALSTAEVVQLQTSEHLSRMQALLGQAQTRSDDDLGAVGRLEVELASMHSRGENEMFRAEQCFRRAEDGSRRARQTGQHWKREGNFAQAWQRRAEFRENKAREAVERAEESLSRAQSALSHAETQLERARDRTKVVGRDSDGKAIRESIDTTPYENKVAAAQERVDRCEERLNRANENLDTATCERQASDARVASCGEAVRAASGAEVVAANALQSARISIAAVERASEEHERVTSLTHQASKSAHRAGTAVSVFAKHTAEATNCEQEGATNLQAAKAQHISSRQRSSLGCMEISWRLEQLRAFEAPIKEF